MLVGCGICVGFIFQCIGIHCAYIGERHIVHCFVRQNIVCRAGNTQRRQVKVVSVAGGESELLVYFIFYRKRNIPEFAGIVGFIISVTLFAEQFQGIAAVCKVGRNGDVCRAALTLVIMCDASVIEDIADAVRNHGGDIFVFADIYCAEVFDGQAFTRLQICFSGRSIYFAAAVLDCQLPFIAGVLGNCFESVGLSAHGGRCEEDRVLI